MIDRIIGWIAENQGWIFSGIGVTFLLGGIGFIRKRFTKKSNGKKTIKIEQKNEGKNATQIGVQNNYYGGAKDDR